jgi:maltose-binding protein MalE
MATKKVVRKKKQSFLSKNIKWISAVLLILFLIKSGQSCARKGAITRAEKETVRVHDSLTNIISKKDSIITELKFDIKTANNSASAAEKRAQSIQNAVKQFKTNSTTTIKIETVKEDTSKNKLKVRK